MRVVGGELGGRRLTAPPGRDTRPTTDRVREAVFGSLASAGALDGVAVADLFAGSGALGIEALSRGATSCTFVERDRAALAALRANLVALELTDRARVVAGDAERVAFGIRGTSLVLADPPYGFDRWSVLLGRLDAAVRTVVAEGDRAVEAPAGWSVTRARRYGRTWVTFLGRAPDG